MFLCQSPVTQKQVIVEKVNGARIADLDRNKYLVPGDLTGRCVLHFFVYKHTSLDAIYSPSKATTIVSTQLHGFQQCFR